MKKLNLEFPINGDLFETSHEYGEYCLRTISTYNILIHNSKDEEERQQLMKDLFRHLVASAMEARNSQIDFDGEKGKK